MPDSIMEQHCLLNSRLYNTMQAVCWHTMQRHAVGRCFLLILYFSYAKYFNYLSSFIYTNYMQQKYCHGKICECMIGKYDICITQTHTTVLHRYIVQNCKSETTGCFMTFAYELRWMFLAGCTHTLHTIIWIE